MPPSIQPSNHPCLHPSQPSNHPCLHPSLPLRTPNGCQTLAGRMPDAARTYTPLAASTSPEAGPEAKVEPSLLDPHRTRPSLLRSLLPHTGTCGGGGNDGRHKLKRFASFCQCGCVGVIGLGRFLILTQRPRPTGRYRDSRLGPLSLLGTGRSGGSPAGCTRYVC